MKKRIKNNRSESLEYLTVSPRTNHKNFISEQKPISECSDDNNQLDNLDSKIKEFNIPSDIVVNEE